MLIYFVYYISLLIIFKRLFVYTEMYRNIVLEQQMVIRYKKYVPLSRHVKFFGKIQILWRKSCESKQCSLSCFRSRITSISSKFKFCL